MTQQKDRQHGQYPQVGYFGGEPEPKKPFPAWAIIALLVIGVGLAYGIFSLIAANITPKETVTAIPPQQASNPTIPINTVVQVTKPNSTIRPAIAPTLIPTIKPTLTVFPTPISMNPVVLTGKGTKPTDKIYLPEGLIKVNVNYDGPGFFSATIFNLDTGSDLGWVTTGEDKYKGVVLGEAYKAGNYLFNINASGTWKLEIYNSLQLQAVADATGQTPLNFSGQGDSVFPVRIKKTGPYNIKILNKNSSFVAVNSYKPDAFPGLLLTGADTNRQTEKADKMDEGVYFFNVRSQDGSWTLEITPLT
jgi:hypothetical protein